VRGLVDRGARAVVAADLDLDGARQLSDELGSGTVAAHALDVADEAATLAFVEEVERSVGPIGVFFANAGVATGSDAESPDDIWAKQWQVNVMSHVYTARAMLPRWSERGEGHLITTASMAGLLLSLGDVAYSATKHAAVGFAEYVAVTYAAQGVRVSCICPGAVNTAMLRAGAGGDGAKASAIIGGGDVMEPTDAATTILDQLAEDRFLILTHPHMHEFVVGKANDPDRWIRGMSRLWARAQALLS
jgi:NAD(P)-dependent dehydrogenase (short-subunit alcohol dehydrogenase family)